MSVKITVTSVTLPANKNGWNYVDCSAVTAAGATGVMLRVRDGGSSWSGYALRKPGSTWHLGAQKPSQLVNNQNFHFVGLDSSRRFQIWCNQVIPVSLLVYGYFNTDAYFLNEPVEIVPTTTYQWFDVYPTDCPKYASAAFVDIVGYPEYYGAALFNNGRVGFRHPSWTTDRWFASDRGGMWGYRSAIVPLDSNGKFSMKTDSLRSRVFLTGFLKSNEAEFYSSIPDITPGVSGSYQTTDLSSYIIDKERANMPIVIVRDDEEENAGWYYGIRPNGDTYDPYGYAALHMNYNFTGMSAAYKIDQRLGGIGAGALSTYLLGCFKNTQTMYLFDEGEFWLASVLFGSQAPGNLYVGLYRNPYPLDEKMTMADISEPLGLQNYQRFELARGSGDWTISGDSGTWHEFESFTAGEDWGTVYGYFIATAATGGKLICAEEITPVVMTTGKSVQIKPKLTFA